MPMHWAAPTFLTYRLAWINFTLWYAARRPPLSSFAVSELTIASYLEFADRTRKTVRGYQNHLGRDCTDT